MDKLLIVVLVVFGFFALHGYRKGLVRMVFSLAAFFLSASLAAWIAPYAEEFLRTQTPLYEVVQEKCREILETRAEEISQGLQSFSGESQSSSGHSGAELPVETVFGIELPLEAQKFFQEIILGEGNRWIEGSGLYEEWGKQLADMVVQRAAWVLAFFIVGILLGILVHALDILTKLPVLNGMNNFGGLVFGLLQGLVVVWGIFFLAALCQESEFGRQMMASIQGNAFLELIYQYNFLEWLWRVFV